MTNYILKPCPFCGAEPKTNVRYWKCGSQDGDLGLIAEVICVKCGTDKYETFQGDGVDYKTYISAFNKAIEKWNRRAEADEEM